MRVRLVRLAVFCAAVVAFAAPLAAQTFTGRIDVTVADATSATCRVSRLRSVGRRLRWRSLTRRVRRTS